MHTLESNIKFSDSCIWQLQREYFLTHGIHAWSEGEVPHYITNNPVIGKTYAELVLGVLRDLSLVGNTDETVYIVELGAGHGKLCYHILKYLDAFYDSSSLPLPSFCYVLSDFAENNVEFWQNHPQLSSFVEKGWLDFAVFDAASAEELHLIQSKKTIGKLDLNQPIVALANYFFDSIPQELYKVKDQTLFECTSTISSGLAPDQVAISDLIGSLRLELDYVEVNCQEIAGSNKYADLLELYRNQLEDSHIFLPSIGLSCVARLKQLSKKGLVLISADKGEHQIPNLDRYEAPRLVTHGSFSLQTNYHAIGWACERDSGRVIFPNYGSGNLDIGCFMFLPNQEDFNETGQAFQRFVKDYSPDDYFTLKKVVERVSDELSFEEMISAIRMSGYDSKFLLQLSPSLIQLIPDITVLQKRSLESVLGRVWEHHYRIEEADQVAHRIGDLMASMRMVRDALKFYNHSISVNGPSDDIFYKMALCHSQLGEFDKALEITTPLKEKEPENHKYLILHQKLSTTEPKPH